MTQKTGYEKRDVSTKALAGGTLAVVLIIVIFIVFLRDYFIFNVEKAVYQDAIMPDNELIVIEQSALSQIKAYKIIDKDKGIYQIPIDRAMEIIISEYKK